MNQALPREQKPKRTLFHSNPVLSRLSKLDERSDVNAATYAGIASKTTFFLAMTLLGMIAQLLVMSALIVLVSSGRMPDWVCILMLAREFLVSGFRLVAVENGTVIAAGPLGKLKTVFQMAATIALMLFVPIEGAPLLGQPGVIFANVLLYIALALTVISGADYILRNRECIKDM